MGQMEEVDAHRIAAFVRKITTAPDAETIIVETYQLLRRTARINELRVVYSPAPGRWTEWTSTRRGLEAASHEEWRAPAKSSATAFFDPRNKKAGFVSAAVDNKKPCAALQILAPEVWSALLLRSAVDRVQKSAVSEAELTRATLRARDEERRHIAMELHDDLGQSLASLKLGLKWAEDKVAKGQEPVRVIEEISKARDDVGVMLDKIRDLSHTLYPRILDTLGLAAAVKELAYQAARLSPIRVECDTQGKPRPLSREVEIALYRCCQEAIGNALRHSMASRLGVRICFGRREARITVEDNGKGFNPRALYNSNSRLMSSGFWTIRQRMADVGGAFRLSTAEGRGTVVEMIVSDLSREDHVKGKNKSTHRG
jgi:signal transduction histidine kinase